MTRRKKKQVKAIIIVIVLIIACIFLYAIIFIRKNNNSVIDSINKYNYSLDSRDSEFMKAEYQLLKDVLSQDEIDMNKYAEYLSKLFIIDFYSLYNKDNMYDIGGLEYIHPDIVNNFKLKAQNTIYRYVTKNGIHLNVEAVSIDDITPGEHTYNKKNYQSYNIKISWTYNHDDGYDTKANMVIINDNNILYIVEFNTGDVS